MANVEYLELTLDELIRGFESLRDLAKAEAEDFETQLKTCADHDADALRANLVVAQTEFARLDAMLKDPDSIREV